MFSTPRGRVALTDFMPVGRQPQASTHDYVSLSAPAWLVRRIEGLEGRVELEFRYRPSRDYARGAVQLRVDNGALRGEEVPVLYGEAHYSLDGDLASAVLPVSASERRDYVLAARPIEGGSPLERVPEMLAVTTAFWREWIAYCRYRGPYAEAVRRSDLALKLMSYVPTGAIVASPTTSLPEAIGGERNWDYRYCWLRDSCFTLYALSALGYSGEAKRFHEYLMAACDRTRPDLRIMYGIEYKHELAERVLEQLEGYRGSRPVRTGNAAYRQRQIDVYGEMLDLAWLHRALGGRLDEQYLGLLEAVASFVATHWDEPDQGLWETRAAARHHVHGKLMSWVAMDRAARVLGNVGKWQDLARRIREDVERRAIDHLGGSLRQSYDGGVDSAVLLAPMLGFPLAPQALERTIETVEASLGRNGYLLRYAGEDGLAGAEGVFLVCSFWMVDARLAAGRIDEARELFKPLLRCANDVGLYAEEIEPEGGAFLGNFPQALSHLALIGNAVNLELAERRGAGAVRGSYADRARRAVRARFGWRAIFAAVSQCGRTGRVLSSRASRLAWP